MTYATEPRRGALARELGLDPRQARTALATLRAVVEADGPAQAAGADLLAVAAATLDLGEWREVPPASFTDVIDAFPAPDARRLLVDVLLIPACIEGEVTAAGEAVVRGFARALGVRSHWVGVLSAMRRRRVFAVKRQLVTRAPDARRLLARTWTEDGVRGLWRALQFVLGRYVDPELAAKFRALGALPEGTLGRTFFADLVARGLAFPGEPGGLPERMLHHDLMHVINGYATDPAGECELAGFYAAFTRGEPFTFVVVALATFQIGLPVSPAVVLPARGALDPARFVAAFLRGRRLRVDVMGPWDYGSLMPLPITEVRERLGIAHSQ